MRQATPPSFGPLAGGETDGCAPAHMRVDYEPFERGLARSCTVDS